MDKKMNNLLKDVKLTKLQIIKNPKGNILKYQIKKNFNNFGESYFSLIKAKKIKAWKKHLKQTQNLCVPLGKVKFILFDDRVKSKTYGKFYSCILSYPHNYKMLTIPPNIWYGFQNLLKNTSIIANITDLPHNKSENKKLKLKNKLIPKNKIQF